MTRSDGWTKLALAFLLLTAVSAYRQAILHFAPQDRVHPVLVYAVYILLLAMWWTSIQGRTIQQNMRRFLLAEHGVMLLWATIRFLQEALLWQDVYWMRVSGYLVSIPLALLPLLGLYAAFGLGKPAEYRLGRRWYLLLIPAAALIALTVTNQSHHLVFRSLEGETQPNLEFHPNGGLFLLLFWSVSLEVVRAGLICSRSRRVESRQKAVPFLVALSMLLFSVPYLLFSFSVDYELIEYSAALLFLEVLLWESCIRLGLVLVNTQYTAVFDRSTVAMQILWPDGTPYLRSARARPVSSDQLQILREKAVCSAPGGLELHLSPIPGGAVLWQEDLSTLLATVEQLRESGEELSQEGTLLRQEWAARAQQAALRARSQLYDQLTEEVGGQLERLEQLLARAGAQARPERTLELICLVGTYVKRRCGLRLLEAPDGRIPSGELVLCLRELTQRLSRLGTTVALCQARPESPLSHGLALFSLDALELLLEQAEFSLSALEAELGAGTVRFRLVPAPEGPGLSWQDVPGDACPPGVRALWREEGGACLLTLTEEGVTPWS